MRNPTVGKAGVNYYALLGVPSTATQDEITKAFRKRILQVHLDKMGPEEDTEVCYLTIEAHRILSDKATRSKYDVERSSCKDKAQGEVFIPAGYICYDVGHQQMSRQLLDSISNWTSDYEKSGSKLSDNYFPFFDQIMTQVKCDNNDESHGVEGDINGINGVSCPQPRQHHYCSTCDKNFVTETHHWDSVINPYRAMFFSDQQGTSALSLYFQNLIGPKLFNWEPRHLPSRLLGIWGSPDWSMLTTLHHDASYILKQCDYTPSSNDIAATIAKLESFSNKKSKGASFRNSQSSFLRRSLIQNLVWVLENKEHVEQMMNRMSELLCQDDLQEILCLGMAMRNVLSFQQSEWEQLIQDALKEEQFELAMLWTMLAIESGDKSGSDWFQLGMTIRSTDPVLAHFCFLLSGCNSESAWEELANIFTQNGAHFAAIEYHLNKGNLFQLLHKSRALKHVDPEGAALYSGIYHATRIKGLLQVLNKRSRVSCSEMSNVHNEELEELIESVQELAATSNPLEGFRIIVSTWPDVFEEAPGYWIHRATIQFLRKGNVNLKSAKLILAAAHFLADDERQDEICTVSEEASQLTRDLLERALETNDFELLTDVLMHLNKRTLTTAEGCLEEINPPPKQNADEHEGVCEDKDETDEEKMPPPPQPQATPAPGHKSAMVLLLSGTIHKVKEQWLDAMKDYQNALLSTPECMHRVLPCVSKLVQDIQFYEAVVSQVQREIEELHNSLKKREYPDVDKYNSDHRRSLIFTDASPKMDYGYKDFVSKIQQDPDKVPGPPPEDEPMDAPPPPPANTPIVTLDKNSEAIQSGQSEGQMDQLSAALAYVDLLKALPLQMHPGPIVMAASHFLRAMSDTEETGKLYAYRNAIMLMAENLLRVDRKLQATIHHGLTHKHMLSILLSAHEKLSKALVANKSAGNDNEEHENNGNNSPTSHQNENDDNDDTDNKSCDKDMKKTDLIRKSEAHVISKLFKNVVNFPKVEPLASIPTLNCSDLVYVETLGNSFLSQFCTDKVRQKHQSPMIPKHLHAYTHFVEVWKGRSTLSDFPEARVKAMEQLLALKGWTMASVERKMSWPFLTLQNGFSPSITCLLKLRDPMKSYRSIDGFHIDYEKGQVSLLLSRDTLNPVDTLFDIHDIRDVVSLNRVGIMDKIVFSLEAPDPTLSSHPFKEARVSLGQNNKYISGSQQKLWSQIPESIQATLSRVSLLLCYLASGTELCSEAPFWMRGTHEGLLSRLDEHLQHFARPISWRKAERRSNLEEKKSPFEMETINKFWLNMVEVFEEIEEDEESGRNDNSIFPQGHLTYRVGNMRTEVRPNTLVMTLDPTRKSHKLSPEAEFCRDLTKHYQELGRAFPELLRIEELVKISVVCSKLKQVLKENRALMQEYTSSCDSSNGEVKAIAKVCSVIENFLAIKPERQDDNLSSSCNWFPATFCHNMDTDVYDVSAGIELDPVVTYGPVAAPPKPISIPLSRVINPDEVPVKETCDKVDNDVCLKEATVIQVPAKEEDECSEEDDDGVDDEESELSEEDGEDVEEECQKDAQQEVEVVNSLSDVPEESDESEDDEDAEEEDSEDAESVIDEDGDGSSASELPEDPPSPKLSAAAELNESESDDAADAPRNTDFSAAYSITPDYDDGVQELCSEEEQDEIEEEDAELPEIEAAEDEVVTIKIRPSRSRSVVDTSEVAYEKADESTHQKDESSHDAIERESEMERKEKDVSLSPECDSQSEADSEGESEDEDDDDAPIEEGEIEITASAIEVTSKVRSEMTDVDFKKNVKTTNDERQLEYENANSVSISKEHPLEEEDEDETQDESEVEQVEVSSEEEAIEVSDNMEEESENIDLEEEEVCEEIEDDESEDGEDDESEDDEKSESESEQCNGDEHDDVESDASEGVEQDAKNPSACNGNLGLSHSEKMSRPLQNGVTQLETNKKPIFTDFPAIDGKPTTQQKKDLKTTTEKPSSVSKGAFLSRRGRIMIKGNQNGGKDELERECSDDDEEQLIIST